MGCLFPSLVHVRVRVHVHVQVHVSVSVSFHGIPEGGGAIPDEEPGGEAGDGVAGAVGDMAGGGDVEGDAIGGSGLVDDPDELAVLRAGLQDAGGAGGRRIDARDDEAGGGDGTGGSGIGAATRLAVGNISVAMDFMLADGIVVEVGGEAV